MGSEGVLNYLRHCVYDALAEHMARHKKSTIEPETIKLFKDRLLRVPFEIEAGGGQASTQATSISATSPTSTAAAGGAG